MEIKKDPVNEQFKKNTDSVLVTSLDNLLQIYPGLVPLVKDRPVLNRY